MKNRFGLMGKIAFSLFITSLIILFLGMVVLYSEFSAESVRMNALLQESNLEIAGGNIAEKMDAAENAAISLFFDKNIRDALLGKKPVFNELLLHNQVYAAFLRILNTVSISHIVIYRKDGFSVSAGLESDFGHEDYESCLEEIRQYANDFSEDSHYAVWIPVTLKLQSGFFEHYFMNARILRDIGSNEPVGILAFYIGEKSIREMYAFFGRESYLADAVGNIISAQDPDCIGEIASETSRNDSIRVAVNGKRWFLTVVPENRILQATQDSVFWTAVTAVMICTVLSLGAALFISRGLTRNLKRLKEVMEGTGAGKLWLRYQGKSRDEVDYLGNIYNKALDDIQGYIAEDKKKQKQIQAGEIQFLHAQINPHLLYNTLDVAIFYMEKSNVEVTLQILRSMSGFFKLSLKKGEAFQEVRKELEHIQYYMELQRLCRGKEIELVTNIPQELLELQIPCVTLQPIVENAYLHAFSGNIDDGWIRIDMEREEDDSVRICITDNGLGMEEEKVSQVERNLRAEKCSKDSYGLWNVYRRLKLYYGESCTMSLESEFGEYTRVVLTIRKEHFS